MSPATSNWKNNRVVITGASSGMGAAMARELARHGARIALLARRVDRLKELAEEIRQLGGEALIIPTDVSRDGTGAGTLAAAAKKIVKAWEGMDTLIANAGFGVTGPFHELTLADYHRQFDTNLWGAVRSLQAFYPDLEKSKGRVALIGSVAGHVSAPGTSAYSMSKYALRALAESLQGEWHGKGISVTHIAPGFIDTEIHHVDSKGKWHREKVGSAPPNLMMPAPQAAKQILSAVWRRKPERVITWHGKGIVLLTRLFPGLVRIIGRGVKFDKKG